MNTLNITKVYIQLYILILSYIIVKVLINYFLSHSNFIYTLDVYFYFTIFDNIVSFSNSFSLIDSLTNVWTTIETYYSYSE